MVNFSAIPSRSAIGRVLRLPLSLIPADAVLPVLQGPLRGFKWISGSSNRGCWLGSYEYEKQRLFASMVRPWDVVFDVGAHVGYYTLLAARRVGSGGRVIAFEPVPANVKYVRKHIALNALGNVQVVEAAVSDEDGCIGFRLNHNSSMGCIDSQSADLTVTSLALDRLVGTGEAPAPNVVKIDVEGAEASVLRGATDVLCEYRPVVFLATHGGIAHHESCALLKSQGYALYGVTSESVQETDEIVALHPHCNTGRLTLEGSGASPADW